MSLWRSSFFLSVFVFAALVVASTSAFQVLISQASPSSLRQSVSTSVSRQPSRVGTSNANVNLIQPRTTRLESTASKEQGNQVLPAPVDYDALLKYHVAVAVQMTIFAGLLIGFDSLTDLTGVSVPFPLAVAFFYALSLKSRVFNPLNNARPNVPKLGGDDDGITDSGDSDNSASPGFRDRVMPTWTPPGFIFPIMWVLIIGPLRAYSSALVVDATGHHFFHPAILAFLFHLSVGDVWNTINNTEKRYGASVTAVLCVLVSLLNAAHQYHNVDSLAGNLMGLVVLWLSVATCLVTATWQLNPNPGTGEKDPLYPVEGEAKTEFVWFQNQ